MIGNDVIDLTLASLQSNWRRAGFLNKVFTHQEQQNINLAEFPDQLVWRLWSMKEAAYKIWNRDTGLRAFNPVQFECFVDDTIFGKVTFKNSCYFTQTTYERDKLHTVAVANAFFLTKVVVFAESQNIFKKGCLPFKKDIKTGLEYPISVSHHGKYWQAVMLT